MTGIDDLQQTDPAGLETLEQFQQAHRFNQWLFNSIAPYCKGRVLEVGSGIGNLSTLFLDKGFQLTATDLREEYCQLLQQRFGQHPNLQQVVHLGLADQQFEQHHAGLIGQFDTVVAINVVEHIRNHQLAIEHCKQLLRPGGVLIVLVPAWQGLFNSFDTELGHFRRYSARSLSALLSSEQMEVTHTKYFNLAGIAGWWFNGSLLRKKIIPGGQLKIFDALVPVFRLLDIISFRRIGLSVIAAARR
ncbi:class I SAM-dependent methyltransferase [Pseudoflavitalea sp. G-6-1-2]|uniref:class I SAM-dependent methyltransferase n=1 Tax=Pseudoflavitalea sp. G-6-1-2 TaxID=2728841 RepID=UPI00146E3854|nr:class I SAM-dependent methyltransferase [Pseudoflavitalea sp. G-6-1-2]NML20155.1 class I SAM-dependent methyltransferase [Pseudoflavitalea sp. G-6-1-2]